MKSLTVRLPEVVVRRIEKESLARGVSKSDIVRERLDHAAPASHPTHSLLDILEESWSAPIAEQPAAVRSPAKHKLAKLIRAKKLHH